MSLSWPIHKLWFTEVFLCNSYPFTKFATFALRLFTLWPHSNLRKKLAYVFIPMLQKECDLFASRWNGHRIRNQAHIQLPTGRPDHIFEFPEEHGLSECGMFEIQF